MSHARVEEVSDSDSDPSEAHLSDFEDGDIIRQVTPSARSYPASTSMHPSAAPQQTAAAAAAAAAQRQHSFGPPTDAFKNAHVLYPIYFDASRTRAQGRRVGKDLAVASPLARTIAEACSMLRLQPMLEPSKTHPKDWANPGRVRVRYPPAELRGSDVPEIHNKHQLYMLVAQYMRQNPTTDKCNSLRTPIPSLPLPMPKEDEDWPRPAVPRGWKMNEFLPLLSPALTGGGVSEDLFKDMMKHMQNGGNPMAALMGGSDPGATMGASEPAAKKKKDKKGKGKA
ncbi:Signal recognition particle SEC65 subunit [Ceratocystis platani]|uniref:Signal recognition particle SEC65 subunit n=1 Tax=Ceratocystis fimbriata f. sp. platani TaxID=88771 RepID=A0A0F8D9J7_CERFI|nr:Signal recognition particle SEC65 subunit [Ceratocystis platani]